MNLQKRPLDFEKGAFSQRVVRPWMKHNFKFFQVSSRLSTVTSHLSEKSLDTSYYVKNPIDCSSSTDWTTPKGVSTLWFFAEIVQEFDTILYWMTFSWNERWNHPKSTHYVYPIMTDHIAPAGWCPRAIQICVFFAEIILNFDTTHWMAFSNWSTIFWNHPKSIHSTPRQPAT